MVNKRQSRGRKHNKSRRTRKRATMRRRDYKKQRPVGGSANLDLLSKEYYYAYNSNPDIVLKGGKRRRVRKGGGLLDGAYSLGPALDSQNVNVLMGAKANVDSDVTHQPAASAYQDNTIPTA